jgi:NitT/TauT family transport system substrate-binding protein
LDNVVGVSTGEAIKTHGEFIRKVIRARRKAVKFMIEHPDEAGDLIAKDFNITPEVARNAVRNLTQSMTEGVPYWGEGQIHLDGMKRIIEVQKSVGALSGEFDLEKMIDTQFLPDDLKTIKK